MEFEYGSIITINERDMVTMCNDVKNGKDFADAFDDVMSGYDSCDYYHMGDIYFDVEEEIKRRIRESEREEIKIPVTIKEMTDEELITLRKTINETLTKRNEAKVKEAIENFRKAFEEVKEVVDDIAVGDEWAEDYYSIEDFDAFHFDY